MLETIIVALIVGAISSAVSNYIAFKVMQSSTRLEFDAVKSNISRHDAALGRAVYRDHCDSCKDREEVRQKHSDERHQELVRRTISMEDSFRSCFDDLVKHLSK